MVVLIIRKKCFVRIHSAVKSRISMLGKALAMHKSYKGVVELEDGNDILSDYQIYRVQIKGYNLCTALLI